MTEILSSRLDDVRKGSEYSIDRWFDVPGVSELAHRERSAFKPIYTINRYWARRSSVVFRSILVGLLTDVERPMAQEILSSHDVRTDSAAVPVILDPFMGGGTTVLESLRMGAAAVGNDLNPLSRFIVEVASTRLERQKLDSAFERVEQAVEKRVNQLYSTTCPCCGDSSAELLHAFWRKEAPCATCGEVNRLARTSVIGRRRSSIKAEVVTRRCRDCELVSMTRPHLTLTHDQPRPSSACSCGSDDLEALDSETVAVDLFAIQCGDCEHVFSAEGPLTGKLSCPSCDSEVVTDDPSAMRGVFECACGTANSISAIATKARKPLAFHLSSIEGYCPKCEEDSCSDCKATGRRFYKSPDDDDRKRVRSATRAWAREKSALRWPRERISDYEKTNRLTVNGYTRWSQLFNDRQLSVLTSILAAIRLEPEDEIRTALVAVFLGTLEHQNMLNMYYMPYAQSAGAFGRHDFHPKVEACEGNPWGGSKGRGTFKRSFLALVEAQKYLREPWDASYEGGKRQRVPCGPPISASRGSVSDVLAGKSDLALSNVDSRRLADLPDQSIDHVVSDPPYADSVQYAELADFFLVWIRAALGDTRPEFDLAECPKVEEIVENKSRGLTADDFYEGLEAVFSECRRVLKDEGRLVFTFHHSRRSNWIDLHDVLDRAGFELLASYPVASEGTRSGNLVFHTNKSSIAYDIVHVCRKRRSPDSVRETSWAEIEDRVSEQTERYLVGILDRDDHGQRVTEADAQIMLWSAVLAEFSKADVVRSAEGSTLGIASALDRVDDLAVALVESAHTRVSDSGQRLP